MFEYRLGPNVANRPLSAHLRNKTASPAIEWLSLGFNCGGAALSWICGVGSAATAPVTGGQSLWAGAALWGGALATSATCSVSIFRVGAMISGHSSIDTALGNNGAYLWTMRGLDVVGLLGVGGALKDIIETRDAMDAAGVEWDQAAAGQMSRQQRKIITESLGLVGSKRVAGKLIGKVVKQRLLAAIASGIAISGSMAAGATHDLIVWIVSPTPKA